MLFVKWYQVEKRQKESRPRLAYAISLERDRKGHIVYSSMMDERFKGDTESSASLVHANYRFKRRRVIAAPNSSPPCRTPAP
jgi:hypothetical protein